MKNTSNPPPKKPYQETSVSPGLSGWCAPAQASASLGRNAKMRADRAAQPCCSPCSRWKCAALSAENCLERKEQGAQQRIFLHSELMVEFLENPVKLENEGSQTFVQLIAPICAEEGSRLEEGYQRHNGTGCSSQCAYAVSGSLLFYFSANTFKRLLGSGLTRLYSRAAELLRR